MGAFSGMMGGNSTAGGNGSAAAAAEPVNLTAATAGVGGAGGGGGGGAVGSGGGYPGAGLTNYTRPTSSFAPENAGRPTSLKTGLLSATETRGPTMSGGGGSAMPMSPAHAGMLGNGKGENEKDNVTHARIVVGEDAPRDGRLS
jgi:hypothetical protein